MNQLRFAPLIRVSTEGQDKRGESLRTQRAQILRYVSNMGGVIPEHCWQYSGQEHATPDYERKKLDKLLKDAGKDLFDAVIVCDASRWSRDNRKSKEGLEILRQNSVRFYIGQSEQNLFSPEACLFLGMAAEIGEFQARQQSLKSIQSRIARAERGLAVSGKLPFGRIFNKKTGQWGIDLEKLKAIRWAAERYLAGDMVLSEIARILGMNASNMWKILTKRSGTEWVCGFSNKKLNIDETVTIPVPPLLDEETIAAIKERAAANKTYTHREPKYQYLLSRMIFCEHCGYVLGSQRNHNGKTYYKHPKHRKPGCQLSKWVPANLIEPAVLVHLFAMFGDVSRIEQAIHRATPDHSKVTALLEELNDLKARQGKARQERENIVRLAAKGLLSDDEVGVQIKEIRLKLATITDRIAMIESQVEGLPKAEQVRQRASTAARVMQHVLSSPEALLEMSHEQKKKLVQSAFAGKDKDGRRLGVYVRYEPDQERPWRFEIRGILETIVTGAPISEDEFRALFPNGGADELVEQLGGSIFTWPYRVASPL
jgi:DNA invertase Pin-like site-specific DNA recombinase